MSSGGSSVKQSNRPWKPQGQMFQQLYDFAGPLLNQELQYFPQSTVAGRHPYQSMGTELTANLASGGSPMVDAAAQQLAATQRGDFLTPDSNPWLRETFDMAAQDVGRAYMRTVMPALESRFGGAGRSELVTNPNQAPRQTAQSAARAAAEGELSDSLSQMAANLYGGNYGRERALQATTAATAVPAVRGQQFRDAMELRAAGAEEFDYQQAQLNDLINRFNFEQYEPYERGMAFQGLISQPGGGYGFTAGRQSGSPGGLQYGGLGLAGLGATGSLITALSNAGLIGGAAAGGGSAIGSTLAAAGPLLLAGLCHCAAEYFGWYTPKWYAARSFILRGGFGQRFLDFYRERSADLAEIIRMHPRVREYFRPLFEAAAEAG